MHGRLLAIGILFATAHAARADQCELVTEAQAETAKLIIKGAESTFVSFCEPCRDKAASIARASSVEVRKDHDKFSLYLNGKPVDLAYTYFPLPRRQFRNLAIAVGCAVEGVSETITAGQIR